MPLIESVNLLTCLKNNLEWEMKGEKLPLFFMSRPINVSKRQLCRVSESRVNFRVKGKFRGVMSALFIGNPFNVSLKTKMISFRCKGELEGEGGNIGGKIAALKP